MARANVDDKIEIYQNHVNYFKQEILRLETIHFYRKQMGIETPITMLNQLRVLYKRLLTSSETLKLLKD